MAGSVNKATLIGNLTRDPELRSTQDGTRICQISVATNDRWKDKSGEIRDKAEYHRIVIFNERLADLAEKYLRKGSKVYLEGQIQTRKWNDKDGTEKYSTEIVLGKFRGELVLLDARRSEAGGDDDEIPFS